MKLEPCGQFHDIKRKIYIILWFLHERKQMLLIFRLIILICDISWKGSHLKCSENITQLLLSVPRLWNTRFKAEFTGLASEWVTTWLTEGGGGAHNTWYFTRRTPPPPPFPVHHTHGFSLNLLLKNQFFLIINSFYHHFIRVTATAVWLK